MRQRQVMELAWERVDFSRVEDFHFHDTRHHFASWFMMRGGGLLALKEILGHTDTKMTQRYAHLEPDHLRAEMTAAIPARISRP